MRKILAIIAICLSTPCMAQQVTIIGFPTTFPASGLTGTTLASNVVTGSFTTLNGTTTSTSGAWTFTNATAITANASSVSQINPLQSTNATATLGGGAASQFFISVTGSTGPGVFGTSSVAFETGGTGGLYLSSYGGGGVTIATGTSRTNAVTISNSQVVQFPAIGSDAAVADSTACIATTGKTLLTGTGTIGICLGTSTKRAKREWSPIIPGLEQILRLSPVSFYYKPGHGYDPNKMYYGFLAEDVVKVIPKLVEIDPQGRPNSVDILGMVPVLVNAMHQLFYLVVLSLAGNISLLLLFLRLRGKIK